MSEIPPSVSDESGGGSRWAQPGVVTIRCRQDGPLVIELPAAGDGEPTRVRVIDHEGGARSRPRQQTPPKRASVVGGWAI